MATKTNATVNEPGIIGQMYEDRKTKKVGVLESREAKFKTLMMRDKDGKTFNITYSTFKSNWRKYNGEEVVQTSTQVEEERTEEKKREESAKKIVESKPEVVKASVEERRKRIRAIEDRIHSVVSSRGLALKVDHTSKGGVIVRNKKYTIFEVWDAHRLDKYSFRMKDVVSQFVDTTAEKEDVKGSIQNIRYRVKYDDFDDMLAQVLDGADKYIQSIQKVETKEKEEE